MADSLTSERRSFRSWLINALASALLVLLWWGFAWVATRALGNASQEHYFLMIVAVTVALHLPVTRGNR